MCTYVLSSLTYSRCCTNQLEYYQWHPSKPAIASTTNLGNILIWHIPVQERWGAFAGGFEEIDVNVEYEEREDEFDIVSLPSFLCPGQPR